MSAIVITPCTGHPGLLEAVYSVRDQTYNTKHLIVVDGPEFLHKIPANISTINPNASVICLPENVGKNGFCGHRIFAGFAHLVNEDYIFFLDDDNWIERNHVSSLVDCIEKNKYDWAYSLRNIVDEKEVIPDNCESLGNWPVWTSYINNNQAHYHVDTSCYAFTRKFLIQVSQFWHVAECGDRIFLNTIKDHSKFGTSGKRTMNYRISFGAAKLSKDFIIQGNSIMNQLYKGKFPWVI